MKPTLNIVLLIVLASLGSVAQQRPNMVGEYELALEISNLNARPWEILAFEGGSGETSNFRRIKSWTPSSPEEIVRSLVFRMGREGAVVIARLSVRLENEKEVLVGTYRLSGSETVKTEELIKVGLEPLVLKVVKAKPPFKDPLPPIPPGGEQTKAIAVISFYPEAAPSASFQLTLRNISNKNIIALDLFMPSANGNGGSGQRSRGDKTQPVMIPDGVLVYHIHVSRDGRVTPEGFVPDVPLPRTLFIRTVVFDDGTYEGVVEPAAEMEAQRRGLDIQRRRILHLLQEPRRTEEGEGVRTLNDLKEQAYALGKTADASVALELITHFPSLDEKANGWLIQHIERGLRQGKLEFLSNIKDFEHTQNQSAESFEHWIKQTTANYEKLALR